MSKHPMTPTTFRLGEADRKRIEILRKRLKAAWKIGGNKRTPSKGDAVRWALRHTEEHTRP